jgi:hypothetical protein
MKKWVFVLLLLGLSALLLTACTSTKEDIRVTFTGEGCIAAGPTKLSTGDQTIIFKDSSDKHATF